MRCSKIHNRRTSQCSESMGAICLLPDQTSAYRLRTILVLLADLEKRNAINSIYEFRTRYLVHSSLSHAVHARTRNAYHESRSAWAVCVRTRLGPAIRCHPATLASPEGSVELSDEEPREQQHYLSQKNRLLHRGRSSQLSFGELK